MLGGVCCSKVCSSCTLPGGCQVPGTAAAAGAALCSDGVVFLKRCACAACFCPHTCPLGSLMAQRCAYLHFALLHCPRLKRRHKVLLPCLVARFVIASAFAVLGESLSWPWMTPLVPLPLLLTFAFACACAGALVDNDLLCTRLQQCMHVTADLGHFMQSLVQGPSFAVQRGQF